MSKDIWHTASKIPEEDRMIVVKSKRTGEYLVGSEFEFILENFTKWAYFDDLLALETELKRTRKALDVAIDALKKIGFGCGIPPDENYAYNYINIAAGAYQQIQELEQKDK